LPEVKADAPALSLELVNSLIRAAPLMAWRQTGASTRQER